METTMRITGLVLCTVLLAGGTIAHEEARTVHVFVALCDNETQGIVPVPEKLGNGNDPGSNLYWGALYGVKTFFKRSSDWTLMRTEKDPGDGILERCVFRCRSENAYLVADAYRGSKIRKTLEDFLAAAAGSGATDLKVEGHQVGIKGAADLVVYVGHNGLMDFRVTPPKVEKDVIAKPTIVLACRSQSYFEPILSELGCECLLLTTGLMAPEAYPLESALAGWLAGEKGKKLRNRAAHAYHRYQKCGLRAATRLFYSEE